MCQGLQFSQVITPASCGTSAVAAHKGSKAQNAFQTLSDKGFPPHSLKKTPNDKIWFNVFQIISSILRVFSYFCSPFHFLATRFSNSKRQKSSVKAKKKTPPYNFLIAFQFYTTAREFERDWEGQAVRIKKRNILSADFCAPTREKNVK